MGKYQLDDKGRAQVQRFHDKLQAKKTSQEDRQKDLRQRFLAKLVKKGKSDA